MSHYLYWWARGACQSCRSRMRITTSKSLSLGPIIAGRQGRQAGRAGVIQIPRAASATPYDKKRLNLGKKKRIKNLPRSDCRSFSVERESLSPPPEVQHVYGREAPLLANRLNGSCQSLAVALPCMGSYHDLVLFSQKSSNPETLHGPRP